MMKTLEEHAEFVSQYFDDFMQHMIILVDEKGEARLKSEFSPKNAPEITKIFVRALAKCFDATIPDVLDFIRVIVEQGIIDSDNYDEKGNAVYQVIYEWTEE